MRVLEQKGYVDHEKSGRAFVYHPVVPKSEARRKATCAVGTTGPS